MRQITEKHSQQPECAVCHVRIDPFGFALEGFDAIGRTRDQDLGGRPIDTHTKLNNLARTRIDGLPGLRDYLANERRDDIVRTFCRKLLGYALGRGLKLSDGPLIEEMQTALRRNGHRFSSAVETILKSRQFRHQRGLEATREDAI